MKKSRNNRKYLIFTIAATAVCIAPFALMSVDATTQPIGNEQMSQWPALHNADGSLNTDYLSGIGDYIEGRIAFRPQMITADSMIKDRLFQDSSQESVIAGTHGWLYYSATLDDYQHNHNVSERVLFNEAHNIRLMQDYVESQGRQFLFTIAPNKNTLYGNNMPSQYKVQVAAQSDFERLVPYLQAEGVHYVDLDQLFRSQKEALYYARDSHWNEKGAVMVYNALLDAAGKTHDTYADVQPTTTHDYYGDLGRMLYPAGAEPEDQLHYLTSPTWQYTTDTSSVEEDFIQTREPDGQGRLLMYRDSFGNSLLPYLAQTYQSATFTKLVPYDIAADLQKAFPEAGEDAVSGKMSAGVKASAGGNESSSTGNSGSGNGPSDTDDLVIVERVERHLPTLSEVPSTMPAPQQDLSIDLGSLQAPDTQDNGSTLNIALTPDGTYTELTGTVAPSLMSDRSRIYAAVTDQSSTRIYEAFCVNTKDSDDGFQLYIPAADLDGDILETRILVQKEEDSSDYTMALDQKSDGAALQQEGTSTEESTPDTGNTLTEEGSSGITAAEAGADETDKDAKSDAEKVTTDSTASDETGKESAESEKAADAAAGKKAGAENTAEQSDSKTGADNSASAAAAKTTEKPAATTTPESTEKPTATAAPKPTDKPAATATPKPTDRPTAAPKPTPKPAATAAPAPQADTSAAQSQASENTNAQASDAAAQPAATPEPTPVATPEPTPTPAPAQPTPEPVHEVSREYVEDCGFDTGYWVITYSDGHQEIQE